MSTYNQFNNKLTVGSELICKYRGKVTVVKIENNIMLIEFKNKQSAQYIYDLGKTLFFSEADLKSHEYNPGKFPAEKYAPYQNSVDIKTVEDKIEKEDRKFFEGMSYHEREKYKEEQYFNKVEGVIANELNAVSLELDGALLVNNGNSESFDPGVHGETTKLWNKKTELIAKKNKPYYAEIIEKEKGSKPVYIGLKAIQGYVVDARDRKYADIIRLKEYKKAYLRLLREFWIEAGYFIDFSDSVNEEDGENVVADPFLLRILEYNRDQQEMVNIAQTIRDDQHRVIIRPTDENFIVEGCAGSGKTMILLHRLSSLVFNEPDFEAENLVIISPNNLLDQESKKLVSDFEIEKAQKGSINALYLKWVQDYMRKHQIYNDYWKRDYSSLIENNSLDKDAVSLFYSRDFAREFGEVVRTLFRNYNIKLDGFDFVQHEKKQIAETEKHIFGGNFDAEKNPDLIKYHEDMALKYGSICEQISRTNVQAKMEDLSQQIKQFKKQKKNKDEDSQIQLDLDDLYKQMLVRLEEQRESKEIELMELIAKKIEFKNPKDAFEELLYEERREVLREKIQTVEGEIASINRDIKRETEIYEKKLREKNRNDASINLQKQYDILKRFYDSGELRGDVERTEKGDISLSTGIFKPIFDFEKKYSGKTHKLVLKNNGSEMAFWKNNYRLYKRKIQFEKFLNGEKREYLIEVIESVISYWKAYSNIDTFKHYEFELFLLLKGLQALYGQMDSNIKLISIDEYQDYAPAEIDLLRQLFNFAVINLYGDPNQRINPKTDDEIDRSKYEQYKFFVNYRNGRQIAEFINEELGTQMEAIGIESKIIQLSASELDIPIPADKRVALIVKSEKEYEELVYDKSKDNLFTDDNCNIDKRMLNVIPVRMVKGLEFEDVYVYDKNLDENERYVAYTRALKTLNIIRC